MEMLDSHDDCVATDKLVKSILAEGVCAKTWKVNSILPRDSHEQEIYNYISEDPGFWGCGGHRLQNYRQ